MPCLAFRLDLEREDGTRELDQPLRGVNLVEPNEGLTKERERGQVVLDTQSAHLVTLGRRA